MAGSQLRLRRCFPGIPAHTCAAGPPKTPARRSCVPLSDDFRPVEWGSVVHTQGRATPVRLDLGLLSSAALLPQHCAAFRVLLLLSDFLCRLALALCARSRLNTSTLGNLPGTTVAT
jgi:hypothetical protein